MADSGCSHPLPGRMITCDSVEEEEEEVSISKGEKMLIDQGYLVVYMY